MELITLNEILARDGNKISPRALYMLMQPLVEAIIEWRDTSTPLAQGTLNEDTIAFSLGYKQVCVLAASSSEQENIASWGKVWLNIITTHGKEKGLEKIARQCITGEISTLEELHLVLERRVNKFIYKLIIAIILACLAIMATVK